MSSSSLTAAEVAEVAENLQLSASTVRRYKAARKIYCYPAHRRLVFPGWQFTQTGAQALPGLNRVLAALPDDLHPESVAGFFRSRIWS